MAFKKVRSDCMVGTFEKSRGLPIGTIRHESGRKVRKDKRIGSIRKEYEKKGKWLGF